VLKLNFQDDNFDYEIIKGSYPGPINNYFISNFKDLWIDPLESEEYTNHLNEDNLSEQVDYTILNLESYNVLKSYFGSIFDLKRKAIAYNDEVFVEVNLNKVTMILLKDFS